MKKKPFPIPRKTGKTLKELGIVTVYLFGSRARGYPSQFSDYDFGIIIKDPHALVFEESLYQKIYQLLAPLTKPKTVEAQVIDIVFLQSTLVPLELKMHIVLHGILLMDETPLLRVSVEENIMLLSADFAPLRREMSETLLARI